VPLSYAQIHGVHLGNPANLRDTKRFRIGQLRIEHITETTDKDVRCKKKRVHILQQADGTGAQRT